MEFSLQSALPLKSTAYNGYKMVIEWSRGTLIACRCINYCNMIVDTIVCAQDMHMVQYT